MRYMSWDVLIFPDLSRVPIQEYRTTCQVIQDIPAEPYHSQHAPQLLPTVTSFIPGLPAGAPFRISIHSWQNPELSRSIQAQKRPSDTALFEARILVDGKLAGSKWFRSDGPWPTVLDLSADLDKNGDFEKLRFPEFHKELLSQSYWNPGDDLGRIKVVIAEGFTRDHLTYPFERVKSVVAFSFQHAPLDVLESSSIAWPNAAMWRQVSFVGPYCVRQTFSPRDEIPVDADAHGHSPRRTPVAQKLRFPNVGTMNPPPPPSAAHQSAFDPFTEPVHAAFSGWRQSSGGDVSMPDYSKANTRTTRSRQVSDPMQISDAGEYQSLPAPGAYDALLDAFNQRGTAVPTNTPRAESLFGTPPRDGDQTEETLKDVKSADRADKETIAQDYLDSAQTSALGHAVKNGESLPLDPKSKVELEGVVTEKENLHCGSPVLFVATNSNGTKRSRIVTPAAAKVIDAEDEPRASTSVQQTSSILKQKTKEPQRRVLGEITHAANLQSD